MTPRRRIAVRLMAAVALSALSCGRGSPRPPSPVPSAVPLPSDSLARRRAADSAARRDSLVRDSLRLDSLRRDSLRADSVLAARPAAPPTPPGPRGRPRQERRCQLDFPNTEATRMQAVRDQASGRFNTYLGGGVVARCVGQDVTLTADSAEIYDTIRTYYLFGNVRYREPRVSIDADRVTYFLNEERILAEQNVRAVLPSGSMMVGPQAEYFRAVAPLRQVAQLTAILRPTITIVQRDSTGKAGQPATLIADRVNVLGDSLFYAGGNVDITRPDLHATSDSAFMDEGRQFGRLIRRPQIEGRGERKFVLRGRVIELYSRNREVERVLAVDSANAVSGELDLRSDSIDLRVGTNKLERAFAWGPSGAQAVSPQRTITSDSLDVRMVNQQVSEVYAVRRAYAESDPDSTKVKSNERDWLKGDTIVARFDSAASADTSSRPRIRELVAVGNASSFHQVPADSGPPSLSYVRGRTITVTFRDQEVQSVVVDGQASGVYLEPGADTTAKRQARPAGAQPAARRPIAPPIRRPDEETP